MALLGDLNGPRDSEIVAPWICSRRGYGSERCYPEARGHARSGEVLTYKREETHGWGPSASAIQCHHPLERLRATAE
jgi:hypothetical protein